jgi:hypothetical protein
MLSISGSVGKNGQNDPADVARVRARLVELGFEWIGNDTKAGPSFIKAIELFQSIKNGQDFVGGSRVDGLIDPNGETLAWLNALNAPRWQRMTAEGVGFINSEAQQLDDQHDFGTSWLDDTIKGAARRYEIEWRSGRTAAPIAVNDTSLPRGGDTPAHKGHETGLVCDLRLPHVNGTFGGLVTSDANYDRNAMRAQLVAFRAEPLVDLIFLNDDVLIAEDLCRPLAGHDNHAHIEIRPPRRS